MIFIKKQLEIYTLSRPYKIFVLVCQFLLQIFILEYDEW